MSDLRVLPYVKVLWLPSLDANNGDTFDVFVDVRSRLKFMTFGCDNRDNPDRSGLKYFRVKLRTAGKNPLIDDFATAASLVGEEGQRVYRLPATDDWIIEPKERLFLEYMADANLNFIAVTFNFEPMCLGDK